VEVTTKLDAADNLVLVERWEMRKHYENYLAWRQRRGGFDKLAAALTGPLLGGLSAPSSMRPVGNSNH
jgi:hypothetical protein